MTDIRFKKDQLNNKLLQSDIGEAFQRFVHDLLVHDYPTLHMFPAGGKDGCIDLSEKRDASSIFAECKYITADGLAAAKDRWKEVARRLESHISHPSHPTLGQRQYSPWYHSDFPVTEYLFCISSILANQDQLNRLQQEIQNFFAKLSCEYRHLAHLAVLSVRVFDWSDLHRYLKRSPHIMFRWFPRTRPIGLIPINEIAESNTFRSYLYSDKLPYYERHRQLQVEPAPSGAIIPDEEKILTDLSGSVVTGLIITGKGGVGKTRLTLEIGRLAQQKGWIVLRCRGNLNAATVIQLAEIINIDHKVLIVADYVEVQRDFDQFVETVIALNDTYDLRIRYIANCRTSFYRNLAAIPGHKQLNLSPASRGPEIQWIRNYQREVVRHILESCQLKVTSDYLDVCRNKPVFAVFMMYLHMSNRGEELAELVGEKDFSNWVAKRLQLTFEESAATRTLAILMMLFPMSDESLHHSDIHALVPILDRLAADGWVEKPSALDKGDNKLWVVAHDVLADQIVISYLDSIPETIQLFIEDALAMASRIGNFRSALVTLQRIADQPPLEDIDWLTTLLRHIRHISKVMMMPLPEDRSALVRTSLLTPLERIQLLGGSQEFWKGAEEEPDFQSAIGWLARWAQAEGVESIDGQDRAILLRWIKLSGERASISNYVLSSGLHFCPEVVQDASLSWISMRPLELQTHYLIVAWLKNGLPPSDIEMPVWQWATNFTFTRQLSFVASSWLGAGGDPELIREHILDWIEEFGTQPEAHFIYRSYLDAPGKLDLIQNRIGDWLMNNAAGPGAASVYRSWLRRGESPDDIAVPFSKWLAAHGEKFEAGLIYRAWLINHGNKQLVEEYIGLWLDVWETDPKAEQVYTAWLSTNGSIEAVGDHIKAWLLFNGKDINAAYIYHEWLSCGADKHCVKTHMHQWIQQNSAEPVAVKVYTAWLAADGDPDSISTLIVMWLDKHCASYQADFLFKAWLKAGGQFSVISPFVVTWLKTNWDSEDLAYFIKFILNQEPPIAEAIEIVVRLCMETPNSDRSLECIVKLIANQHRLGTDGTSVSEAGMVMIDGLLSSQDFPEDKQLRLISELLCLLLTNSQYGTGERRMQLNDLFVRWIRCIFVAHHKKPKISSQSQKPEILHRIRELISAGMLAPEQDKEPIGNILKWMNGWKVAIKRKLKDDIEYLSINYPVPGLWEKLKFESQFHSQQQPTCGREQQLLTWDKDD